MIALDTSALIWAIQGAVVDHPSVRARIEAIDRMGGGIMLPAPVLAEFLAFYPSQNRGRHHRDISTFAFVSPFDVSSAICAAELLPKPRGKRATKQSFKTDVMIYATAIARRATLFVYADGDFVNIAGSSPVVPLLHVDKIHVQTPLLPPRHD